MRKGHKSLRKRILNVRRTKRLKTLPLYVLLFLCVYPSDPRNQLQAILDETGPINIFKFVVNPNDFAQSVENIFYLSFLIRDGNAAFETRDGEPIICEPLDVPQARLIKITVTCEQPSDKDYEDGLKKHQLVLEFDMATWRVSRSLLLNQPS